VREALAHMSKEKAAETAQQQGIAAE
jgi:hypothetical protein